MTLFSKIGRPSFTGAPRPTADVPQPFRGKALRRRLTMFKEASELLPYLPREPGTALHCLMTGRVDLAVQLAAILGFYGPTCPFLRIGTLSFNHRNTSELAELLRSDRVGAVTLLASKFFAANNREEFEAARREAVLFPGRWRIAAARSHAKVICADFGSRKFVMEGSANLRTNSNWEQLTIILDDDLHAWHAGWIDELVTKHERDEEKPGD